MPPLSTCTSRKTLSACFLVLLLLQQLQISHCFQTPHNKETTFFTKQKMTMSPITGTILKSSSPLQHLCKVTLLACEALSPMVVSLYNSIHDTTTNNNDPQNSSVVTKKKDASAFTIADGLVQYLLTEHLFSSHSFRDVVGEEECTVNLRTQPYTVDRSLIVPKDVVPLVDQATETIQSLSNKIRDYDDDNNYYKDLTIFIDPIDGTREFATGKGEQCSICVGFSNRDGEPVAGVVYRPISTPSATWAAGAKSEQYFDCELGSDHENSAMAVLNGADDDDDDSRQQLLLLLTTNGSISPFTQAFLEESNSKRIKNGGAGNKMLLLLHHHDNEQQSQLQQTDDNVVSNRKNNPIVAYIQDRGLSRWDTCAAQACLEAQGGMLCKLTSFLFHDGKEESYTYLRSNDNLDFPPSKDIAVQLTKHNARNNDADVSSSGTTVVKDVTEIKPYANVCGLIALGKSVNTKETKQTILRALQRASRRAPPALN